jgi:hypothetical protein
MTISKGRIPAKSGSDWYYKRIEELERRVKQLENEAQVTVPTYDWNYPPQDPVEGQVAMFINAPDSPFESAGNYGHGLLVDNTFTVPASMVAGIPNFTTRLVTEGTVTAYGTNGFNLSQGVWLLSQQVDWGNASGFWHGSYFLGLVYSYASGVLDYNGESAEFVSDTDAYTTVTKSTMIFSQHDPTITPIVQLGIVKAGAGTQTIESAMLSVVKLSNL